MNTINSNDESVRLARLYGIDSFDHHCQHQHIVEFLPPLPFISENYPPPLVRSHSETTGNLCSLKKSTH